MFTSYVVTLEKSPEKLLFFNAFFDKLENVLRFTNAGEHMGRKHWAPRGKKKLLTP